MKQIIDRYSRILSVMEAPVILSTLALALLFSASPASAGGTSSNGGGMWVCPDSTQNELLDIWEARVISEPKHSIIRTDEAVDAQARKAFGRLAARNPVFGAQALAVYERLASISVYLSPKEVTLPAPPDALARFAKPGCELGGVALFDDEREKLYLDPALLATLPNTDQAALLVHESVYKIYRAAYGYKDSRRARALVGVLFSEEGFTPIPKFGSHTLKCGNLDVSYDDSSFELTLYAFTDRTYTWSIHGNSLPVVPTDPLLPFLVRRPIDRDGSKEQPKKKARHTSQWYIVRDDIVPVDPAAMEPILARFSQEYLHPRVRISSINLSPGGNNIQDAWLQMIFDADSPQGFGSLVVRGRCIPLN